MTTEQYEKSPLGNVIEPSKNTTEINVDELRLLQLKAFAYDSLRDLEQVKMRVVALNQEIEKVISSKANNG